MGTTVRVMPDAGAVPLQSDGSTAAPWSERNAATSSPVDSENPRRGEASQQDVQQGEPRGLVVLDEVVGVEHHRSPLPSIPRTTESQP